MWRDSRSETATTPHRSPRFFVGSASAILTAMPGPALLIPLLLLAIGSGTSQRPQNPTPDQPRPHPRITQTETIGRRLELKSLKGVTLFTGPRFNSNKPVPLIIHFHGAPWLIETHVARSL